MYINTYNESSWLGVGSTWFGSSLPEPGADCYVAGGAVSIVGSGDNRLTVTAQVYGFHGWSQCENESAHSAMNLAVCAALLMRPVLQCALRTRGMCRLTRACNYQVPLLMWATPVVRIGTPNSRGAAYIEAGALAPAGLVRGPPRLV